MHFNCFSLSEFDASLLYIACFSAEQMFGRTTVATRCLAVLPSSAHARPLTIAFRQMATAAVAAKASTSKWKPKVLSPKQIEDFERDGFIYVRDLFNDKEKQDLLRWTSEVEKWPETAGARFCCFPLFPLLFPSFLRCMCVILLSRSLCLLRRRQVDAVLRAQGRQAAAVPHRELPGLPRGPARVHPGQSDRRSQ